MGRGGKEVLYRHVLMVAIRSTTSWGLMCSKGLMLAGQTWAGADGKGHSNWDVCRIAIRVLDRYRDVASDSCLQAKPLSEGMEEE